MVGIPTLTFWRTKTYHKQTKENILVYSLRKLKAKNIQKGNSRGLRPAEIPWYSLYKTMGQGRKYGILFSVVLQTIKICNECITEKGRRKSYVLCLFKMCSKNRNLKCMQIFTVVASWVSKGLFCQLMFFVPLLVTQNTCTCISL